MNPMAIKPRARQIFAIIDIQGVNVSFYRRGNAIGWYCEHADQTPYGAHVTSLVQDHVLCGILLADQAHRAIAKLKERGKL